MKKNSYPGTCKVCGGAVPTGEGALKGGPGSWQLNCIPCSGEVPSAAVMIMVEREPSGDILFRPTAHLGDQFGAYVSALRSGGAIYDGSVNRARVEKALGAIAALEQASFAIQVHPDVSAVLQAFAQQHKTSVADAGARASKVDAALRERGLALYPFQRIGVEWLAARTRALLADDRGLGKTIQSLTAIPEGAPVIVVGPLASLGVWAEETPKWRPDLTFSVVGTKDFHWPARGEMVFCSYGSLPDLASRNLGLPTDGTVVISDEAQNIKTPKSQRTKRFREIAHRARQTGGRVWLLSGSPLLNDPRELWAILQAAGLGSEAFGSFLKFGDDFHATQDQWGGWTFGRANADVPAKLRKVMLRRVKTEVLPDLPATTYRALPVAIDGKWEVELEKCAEQLKLHIPSIYEWLRAGPAAYEEDAPKPGQVRPDPAVRKEEIEAARRTLLSSPGADFHTMSHMRELLAKAKIPALINLVEEFEEHNEPLLVFSMHRAPIDSLSTREGWATITGDHDGETRQKIARDFQNGKYKGLALTIEAGGVALTLTKASQVVFVDRSFTPSANAQAIDRAVRIGQTRGVVVTTLIANHYLDKRLAEILEDKTEIIQSSVEASSIGGEDVPELPPGLAEVDFGKLQATAQETKNAFDVAKAEAERIAAERARNAEELRAKLQAEAVEKKAAEKAKKNHERARANAQRRGWIEGVDAPGRHEAVTDQEKWAAQGLATLSALDPDRARDRNSVGFSKSDGYVGHWLSSEIPMGLTANQWKIAIALCRPYHRQIGSCPKAGPQEQPCARATTAPCGDTV